MSTYNQHLNGNIQYCVLLDRNVLIKYNLIV